MNERATRDGGPQGRDDSDDLEERLLAWLAQRMPEARGLRLTNLRKPGAGMSSDTHLFTIHWSGDGGLANGAGERRAAPGEQSLDAVLRCAPRADGPFPEYDLAMQFGIMRQLGRHTDVPVPEVLWQENDPSWLGVPFLTMKAVVGEPPLDWPSYHASGFYAELSEADRRRLWTATIDAVAKLHRADWRAIGLDFGCSGNQRESGAPATIPSATCFDIGGAISTSGSRTIRARSSRSTTRSSTGSRGIGRIAPARASSGAMRSSATCSIARPPARLLR